MEKPLIISIRGFFALPFSSLPSLQAFLRKEDISAYG